MRNSLLLQTVLLFCSICSIRSEVFTAIAGLEDLLQTESLLIDTLEDYIKDQGKNLEILKRYYQIYKTHYDEASENVHLHVTNPINAYILIKKLTIDWIRVEVLIASDHDLEWGSRLTNIRETMQFPTEKDLDGALNALIRLQDTYRLDTSSLAQGEINGVRSSAELAADDCFEIGKKFYYKGDYYHTQLWMREADAKLKREADETIDRGDILDYWAYSTYKQGNIHLAMDLTNKLLEIHPNHTRALGNKIFYEHELQKPIDKTEKDEGYVEDVDKEMYKKLCRGEIFLPEAKTSQLKCFYLSRNHPFLKIAPFKVEELHQKPDIFIFHNVLADSEIATMKDMAQSRLESAVFDFHGTGEPEIMPFRISKLAWLEDAVHKHIAVASQRIADMTGLSLSTAEDFQVVNYGIGGHYEPHFDFHLEILNFSMGRRIKTVLFYLSDVEQGGATVFPKIQVSVWPKKGSAILWYNLHPSGVGDKETLHAGCPVLIGSKWIATKWIHEHGQEFLRPCTLERTKEELAFDLW